MNLFKPQVITGIAGSHCVVLLYGWDVHIDAQIEAPGYTRLSVMVGGVLFVVSYVGNRLTVKLGPYKNAPRRPRWYQESVQAWAEKRIKELPPEFFAAHQELYGVPA